MTDTNEHDVKISKHVTLGLVTALFILISGLAGCQINKQSHESAVIDAETELVRARTELELKQNETILELIDASINPVAARCAIVGWSGPEQTSLCAFFGKDDNSIRD